MTDRIRSLVKRIGETLPVQSTRRQTLLDELRALRADLDAQAAPEQAHSLDAAVLLLEFMSRSEDVATASTLQIVASLVGTVEERHVRKSGSRAAAEARPSSDVAEHQDLFLAQEFLLGTILVESKLVTPESLARALQLHSTSRLALGQCLVHLGAASPDQIAAAVAYQDHLRAVERHSRREAERRTRVEPPPTDDEHETADERQARAVRPRPKVRRAPFAKVGLRLDAKQKGFVQSLHWQVLGEVLVRLGSITRQQLNDALQLQRAANVHIGEALVQTGAATWDQIKKGLEVQKQLRRAA